MEPTLTSPRRFAKLPTYDTGEWRAATVYAQALLGATEQAKATEGVIEEFDSLIDDVLDQMPKLEAVWESSFVEEDTQANLQKEVVSPPAPRRFFLFF